MPSTWRGILRINEPADPIPLIEPPEWMADALCAQIGGHAWDSLTWEQQVEFCQPCPVRDQCAEFGADHLLALDRSGTGTTVYGGLSPADVVSLAQERRRESAA